MVLGLTQEVQESLEVVVVCIESTQLMLTVLFHSGLKDPKTTAWGLFGGDSGKDQMLILLIQKESANKNLKQMVCKLNQEQ